MSTSQKLQKKVTHKTQQSTTLPTPQNSQSTHPHPHTQQTEHTYFPFYQHSYKNPQLRSTSSAFPHNYAMYNSMGLPHGIECSPILAKQGVQEGEGMSKGIGMVPRCDVCRAYMNCYNVVLGGGKFRCFYCRYDCDLPKYYKPQDQQVQYTELYQPVYQASTIPTLKYPHQQPPTPASPTYILMLDISNHPHNLPQTLHYLVSALKQSLTRPQLDDIHLYLFTYDQTVQEYTFGGEEVSCVVYDASIDLRGLGVGEREEVPLLKDVRDQVLGVLDCLEDICRSNNRRGSRFGRCFQYVFDKCKWTGGKFFIVQSNQQIRNQPLFQQTLPNTQDEQKRSYPSMYQTFNKTFITQYYPQIHTYQCSISVFILAHNFKNVRTLYDCIKACNGSLRVYSKYKNYGNGSGDGKYGAFEIDQAELERFYYEFVYMLTANYYTNLRMELVICRDWRFTAVCGNVIKLNQYITFQINYYENSNKLLILVEPIQYVTNYPPYCAIQIITSYRHKKRSYTSVGNIVIPVTGYPQRVCEGIDTQCVISAFGKVYLSQLRMYHITQARSNLRHKMHKLSKYLHTQYPHPQTIPPQHLSLLQSGLSMLKSPHSAPQQHTNRPSFDRIFSERSFLQFCGCSQFALFFRPCLYDLGRGSLEGVCLEGVDGFVGPRRVELAFGGVGVGVFLLDNGLCLYIYIAGKYDKQYLTCLFGNAKWPLLQQHILNQSQHSPTAKNLQSLITHLRQQKSQGWIPLKIIRCRQGSENERTFYMQFTGEKYGEFRSCGESFGEFLEALGKGG